MGTQTFPGDEETAAVLEALNESASEDADEEPEEATEADTSRGAAGTR